MLDEAMGTVINVNIQVESVVTAEDSDAPGIIEHIKAGLGSDRADAEVVLWLPEAAVVSAAASA